MQKINFPNFFIVGTVRGGTTSLYRYLGQHPEIHMSPIKEPHYFDTDIDPGLFENPKKSFIEYNDELYRTTGEAYLAYIRDEAGYLRLFDGASGKKAIGEATPYYLASRVAAGRVREMSSEARIIAVIRNPVERAWSHYLMDLREGVVNIDFAERIEKEIEERSKGVYDFDSYVELGLYRAQIERYIDAFGKENVKVMLFEDFKDPLGMTREIFSFLGVNEGFTPEIDSVFNRARVPRFKRLNFLIAQQGLKMDITRLIPERLKEGLKSIYFCGGAGDMPRKVRSRLTEYFRRDIMDTSRLIEKDLSAWLR